jgi:membrane peptidoglycan carboxypeptidase
MHPAMQRRRHRLMARRTTRRGSPRRGLATAFLVLTGLFVLFVGGSVAGTAGGLLAAYNYFQTGLPDPHILDEIQLPASTYVYDRTGNVLLARFECQNREQVSFSELPDDIVNATVAAEDRTFWKNDGVDYQAVAAAALANLEAGSIVRGASTITAQVIKYAGSIQEATQAAASGPPSAVATSTLDPQATDSSAEPEVCQPPNLTFLSGRGYEDKIREFIFARDVTAAYPGRAGKEKILDTYMNLIFYGNGSYGIKAAAANYFGISDLSQLTLSQSAFLAGLPQLPSAYDPYYNNQGPDRAISRRNVVLGQMLDQGYITQRQYTIAKNTTWDEMNPHRITSILREPHFSFRVQREAESILASMGIPNPAEAVLTGGYRITTTLDYNLQAEAKKLVALEVNKLSTAPGSPDCQAPNGRCTDVNVHNAALVSIDSSTGEIVAYVGSVDYYADTDQTQGKYDAAGTPPGQQPGSAFKPITYSSAFVARQATPATFFVDNVTQFGPNRATSYMPTDADNRNHGPLLATDALHYSLNVPSVMMQYLVTPEVTAQFAEKMGVASAAYINGRDPGLTLTLGAVPVTLSNLTGAYGVFADEGTLHPATTINEIRDRNGRVIYTRDENGPQATQPMTPAEAYLTHWIISGNTDPRVNVWWGKTAELTDPSGARRDAAAKTGTTNDFRSVTAFGYVPQSLVTGVWMGNSDNSSMSNKYNGAGLFSADGPLYLWHDFMQVALNQPWDWNNQQAAPSNRFEQPAGIVTARICRFSGMAATNDCGPTQTMPFLEGTVPPPDNVHSDGCFDIEKEVAQDGRRPQQWVDAAKDFADRLVNNETKSIGDPTKLKQNPTYRLAISTIPGVSGWGGPLCGELKETPTPEPTPEGSGGGGSGPPFPSDSGFVFCPGHKSCTPRPLAMLESGSGTVGTAGVIPPILALTSFISLIPIADRARRRLKRR